MLEIRNVTCGYGKEPVLRDLSVKVGAGEFVAILGPNGSGKTTLMRALSRVIRPVKGLILFNGRDMGEMSFGAFARKIAVVSNLRDADLPMSVEELVLLGRIPHRAGPALWETEEDLRHVHHAMTLTGTSGFKRRRVDTLSSGERQMVSIARALAQEPSLLLLDEPTSHLDIAHQGKVMDLVRRLNREGALTVVTVLHDLNLASQYCDRLLLLKGGSMVKDGPPGKVLTDEIIRHVYGIPAKVVDSPSPERPYVLLVPETRDAGLYRR